MRDRAMKALLLMRHLLGVGSFQGEIESEMPAIATFTVLSFKLLLTLDQVIPSGIEVAKQMNLDLSESLREFISAMKGAIPNWWYGLACIRASYARDRELMQRCLDHLIEPRSILQLVQFGSFLQGLGRMGMMDELEYWWNQYASSYTEIPPTGWTSLAKATSFSSEQAAFFREQLDSLPSGLDVSLKADLFRRASEYSRKNTRKVESRRRNQSAREYNESRSRQLTFTSELKWITNAIRQGNVHLLREFPARDYSTNILPSRFTRWSCEYFEKLWSGLEDNKKSDLDLLLHTDAESGYSTRELWSIGFADLCASCSYAKFQAKWMDDNLGLDRVDLARRNRRMSMIKGFDDSSEAEEKRAFAMARSKCLDAYSKEMRNFTKEQWWAEIEDARRIPLANKLGSID